MSMLIISWYITCYALKNHLHLYLDQHFEKRRKGNHHGEERETFFFSFSKAYELMHFNIFFFKSVIYVGLVNVNERKNIAHIPSC